MARAFVLGMLAVVTACHGAEPATPDAPSAPAVDAAEAGAPLTVVTINLRCLIDDWDARLPVLADGLAAADADVIAMQEVCTVTGARDALEELTAALAARGAGTLATTRTTTHLAWDMYGEGLAIISRLPIAHVHVASLPTSGIPRKLLAARVVAPGGARVVGVTHLDHQSSTTRTSQAQAALAALDVFGAGAPAVLVGDFNESPGGGVGTTLAGAGFADAWPALDPSDAGFTFPASAPAARIDYVWTRGAAVEPAAIDRILATPVGAIYASDHLGLRATLGD